MAHLRCPSMFEKIACSAPNVSAQWFFISPYCLIGPFDLVVNSQPSTRHLIPFLSQYQWSGQGIIGRKGICIDDLQNNVEILLDL